MTGLLLAGMVASLSFAGSDEPVFDVARATQLVQGAGLRSVVDVQVWRDGEAWAVEATSEPSPLGSTACKATTTQFRFDDAGTIRYRERAQIIVAFRPCASASPHDFVFGVEDAVPLEPLPGLEQMARRASRCRGHHACRSPSVASDDTKLRRAFDLDGFGHLDSIFMRGSEIVFAFDSPTLSPDLLGCSFVREHGGWSMHLTYENGPDPALQ